MLLLQCAAEMSKMLFGLSRMTSLNFYQLIVVRVGSQGKGDDRRWLVVSNSHRHAPRLIPVEEVGESGWSMEEDCK